MLTGVLRQKLDFKTYPCIVAVYRVMGWCVVLKCTDYCLAYAEYCCNAILDSLTQIFIQESTFSRAIATELDVFELLVICSSPFCISLSAISEIDYLVY